MNDRLWIDDIVLVMLTLGGEGTLKEIYREVEKIRDVASNKHWEAAVRMNIEQHSSDSEAFVGKEDLFYSVNGIGGGQWGLRDYSAYKITSPEKENDNTDSPKRINIYVQRIIRSTKIVKKLKRIHGNRCQLCNTLIKIGDNTYYSEGHHIKPLGKPYDGPDIEENILIVCPNCHVLCDNKAIELPYHLQFSGSKYREIGKEFIDFHNNLFFLKHRR